MTIFFLSRVALKKAYILQVNFIFIEVSHIKTLKYFLYKSNVFEALKKRCTMKSKYFGINLRLRFVQLCISGGKDVHGRIVGRSKKIHASHADQSGGIWWFRFIYYG